MQPTFRPGMWGFLLASLLLVACQESRQRRLWEMGNAAFLSDRPAEAAQIYQAAMTAGEEEMLAYNLGTSFLVQDSLSERSANFLEQAATWTNSNELRGKALYNQAWTAIQKDTLESVVDLLKESLRANPKDTQARFNLALAQRLLEMRQPPPPQNQQQQEQQQQEQEQEQDSSGEKPPEPQDSEQQQPQESQTQESSGEEQQSQSSEPTTAQSSSRQEQEQQSQSLVSRLEAQRLLEIMAQEEQKTMQRQRMPSGGQRNRPDKDW